MSQLTLRRPVAGNSLWPRALLLATLLFGLGACGGGGGGGGGGSSSSAASESSSQQSSASISSSASTVSSSSSISSTSSSQSSSVASSSTSSSSAVSSSSSQVSSSAASSSSLASSSAASAIASVKIHYKRQDEIYTGWGLHLWGSAIAPATVTTWQNARAFDGVEEGWAVATVPVVNPAVAFNLITHKGDLKSPTADLSFVPNTSGAQVWVVQDNNNLFFSFEDAQIALAGIGNASSTLDLTSVAPQTNDTGLADDWHQRANFMEIFVRSYQDSDGNGVGDIQGLISQLDYLQSLGITGLWLMPITESSDNDHGYSVIDYRKVESDYGTMADFEQLLEEAHERGIGIIIDYVINHSSSANPLFLDANSAADNDKRDWYIFQNTNPGWTSWGGNPSWHTGAIGFYYGVFTSSLPDFDLRNPEVVDYHMSNLRFWLNKGVDGFRFDATGVLFENGNGQWSDQEENHPLLADAQELVESYGNRYLICEAPDAPADYAGDDSCGNSFAFGNQWTIRDSARNRSLQSGLVNQLNASKRAAMPFILSNHDAFAGSRPAGDLSLEENKVAAAIAILASDTPFTYYGEEVGMSNGNINGDGALRTPMSWNSNTSNAGFTTGTPYRGLSANVASRNVAAQNGVAGSLLEHYRALYQARNQHAALAMGSLNLQSSAGNSRLVFRRTLGNEVAGVLINLSTSAQNLSINTGVNNAVFNQLLPASETTHTSNGSGSITINVPAQSVVVIGN